MLSEKVNDVQIDDSRKEIEQLKRELESRPRLEDLEELQNSLDELESIYQQQLNEKDAIITNFRSKGIIYLTSYIALRWFTKALPTILRKSYLFIKPHSQPILAKVKMIGAGYVKEMVIAVLIVHMKMIYFRMP